MSKVAEQEHASPGFIGKIPVENLFFLMAYAFEFSLLHKKPAGFENNPNKIPDLVAHFLAMLVERRLKRALSFHYQMKSEVLTRVRGRIDFLTTERHQLLKRGKVACRFEEFNIDTPRYRYIRYALERVAFLVGDKARDRDNNALKIRQRCLTLAQTLRRWGVKGRPPTDGEVLAIRYNHYDKEDHNLVKAARLVLNLALLNEAAKDINALAPDRAVEWVRKLFEKAVRGFYKMELSKEGWSVDAPHYNWQATNPTRKMYDILPEMRTDMVLKKNDFQLIIDTKFTSIITSSNHKEEVLKSPHIYQLYAYLRSQEGGDSPPPQKSYGMLLYPAVDIDDPICEQALIQGHVMRFATVDLSGKAEEITTRLLALIGEECPSPKRN